MTERRHLTAGVQKHAIDHSLYWDFKPGQPVMTCDGFSGTVTAVHSGPVGGAEVYEVVLDAGMGGGDYSASQLRTTAKKQVTAAQVEAEHIHVASEDYPELAEILVDRPPPMKAITSAARPKSRDVYCVDCDSFQPYRRLADGTWECKNCGFGVTCNECGLPMYARHKCDEAIERYSSLTSGRHVDEYSGEDGAYAPLPVKMACDSCGHPMKHHSPEGCARCTEDGERCTTRPRKPFKPTGSIGDKVFDWVNDRVSPENRVNEHFTQDRGDYWCRFRSHGECMFPKELNVGATQQAGYAVWIPEDRGPCPYFKSASQKNICPVSEPGPKSGESPSYTDATQSWESGGQRGGTPSDSAGGYRNNYAEDVWGRSAMIDPSFRFHMTAAWSDVRSKAKKLRAEGAVTITSVPNKDSLYVTGTVRGSSDIYEVRLMRVPGSKSATATWECGCEWSKYSWGRSGRWRRFEGRMCSHALALMYEAQSRSMFGEDIEPDSMRPPYEVDAQAPYGAWGNRAASLQSDEHNFIFKDEGQGYKRAVCSCGACQASPSKTLSEAQARVWHKEHVQIDTTFGKTADVAPIVSVARYAMVLGETPLDALRMIARFEPDQSKAAALLKEAFDIKPFTVKVRGLVQHVIDIVGGMLELDNGQSVSPREVVHPAYDPNIGMNFHESKIAVGEELLEAGAAGGAGNPADVVTKTVEKAVQVLDQDAADTKAAAEDVKAQHGVAQAMMRTADANRTGVMVALAVPEEIAKQYLINGGETLDNMHITLAYLGKTEDFDEMAVHALHVACSEIAAFGNNLTGRASGWGTFLNGEQNVLYVGWDIPGLDQLRVDVLQGLSKDHIPWIPDEHGFTPHMTALYTNDNIVELPEFTPSGEVTFDGLVLAFGGEWKQFPFKMFGGTPEVIKNVASQGGEPMMPIPDGPGVGVASWPEEDISYRHGLGAQPGPSGSLEATLHDEPEPALPSTDGSEGDDAELAKAAVLDTSSREWLLAGGGGSGGSQFDDFAGAARAVLAKTSMKTFNAAEQREIINEGIGERASNLDRLDIAGTHYELLEAKLQDGESDDTWLF